MNTARAEATALAGRVDLRQAELRWHSGEQAPRVRHLLALLHIKP